MIKVCVLTLIKGRASPEDEKNVLNVLCKSWSSRGGIYTGAPPEWVWGWVGLGTVMLTV